MKLHTLVPRAVCGCALVALSLACSSSWAKKHSHGAAPPAAPATPSNEDIPAEIQLQEVYGLLAQGHSRDALSKAGKLVSEHPNFQLAQLVYGDILAARVRPVKALGDVPASLAQSAPAVLGDLREEALQRATAAHGRPPASAIPAQFISIAAKTRHAIAVDASRARLYLFENRPTGLALIADFYTSVGKAGVSKNMQGDQRTPLGIYYITSHLQAASLKDFYGSGALPINYPNMLDARRGKTGGGIWLHGTPPAQFSRAPRATDGCIVMSNPDLRRIIRLVEVGTTPVLIAPQLQWVDPRVLKSESKPFEDTLQSWRKAKTEGNLAQLLRFYTADFNSHGRNLEQWSGVLRAEMVKSQGHNIELKDVSFLRWTDSSDTMVVTMGEVLAGQRTGWTKRQYWTRESGEWKIFFEGTL